MHHHFKFFFFLNKYWPDCGPVGPKLVANSTSIKYHIVASDGAHVQFVLFRSVESQPFLSDGTVLNIRVSY